ncbi:uncharacterized protein LOC123319943 isoform X2 [Coccinella septempunctata]|uniref:uncharacterized protein LOC123319943 isoform X2 n=1 Tax=Coccinella septempunctata TaxID=41139 RepID=UPI001D0668EB|nr:uncharacterized protein LOC123319943 isoform X2 [Coccinella septempunctata]
MDTKCCFTDIKEEFTTNDILNDWKEEAEDVDMLNSSSLEDRSKTVTLCDDPEVVKKGSLNMQTDSVSPRGQNVNVFIDQSDKIVQLNAEDEEKPQNAYIDSACLHISKHMSVPFANIQQKTKEA